MALPTTIKPAGFQFEPVNKITQTTRVFEIGMLGKHVEAVKAQPEGSDFYAIIESGHPEAMMIAQQLPDDLNSGEPFWIVHDSDGLYKSARIAKIDGVYFDEVYEDDILVRVHWNKKSRMAIVEKALQFINVGMMRPVEDILALKTISRRMDTYFKEYALKSGVFNHGMDDEVVFDIPLGAETIGEDLSNPHHAAITAFFTNPKIMSDWNKQLFGITPLRAIAYNDFCKNAPINPCFYGLLNLGTLCLDVIGYGDGGLEHVVNADEDANSVTTYDSAEHLLIVFYRDPGRYYSNDFIGLAVLGNPISEVDLDLRPVDPPVLKPSSDAVAAVTGRMSNTIQFIVPSCLKLYDSVEEYLEEHKDEFGEDNQFIGLHDVVFTCTQD